MTLLRMVISNQLFTIKKVVLVILLAGLMLFLPLASMILIDHAKGLAEKPLQMLQTELILQYDKTGRDYKDIRTEGVILPFNLNPIPLQTVEDNLRSLKEVRAFSTVLVLWDFDLGNTRTMIALRAEEPQTGMRKIESLLMKDGRFFSNDDAREIILERHYAKLFGYDLGGAFKLKDEEFKIVGIVDYKEQSNLSSASIFLPYGTALRLAGLKEAVVNQAFLSLKSSGDTAEAARKVEGLFPGASLITKDSLYKNLSGINRLLYQSGRYLMAVIVPVVLFLVVWTFKMHRLDFRYQTDILKTIGWQRRDVFLWIFLDTAVMACVAVFIASVLSIILQKQILPSLATTPLLNQGFTL
ncbi:MAG: ABC transporter permease [Nitrospirae bacterium]|nr:ABC transporter permease [Nitrospirota bacterium]